MSWEDRLQEAAYSSPAGVRLTFQFEDVSEVFSKKTTAFDFPGVNGTKIQDNGHSGRRYPLRIFFSGESCDIDAQIFLGMLRETGIGKLEHPIYKTVDVVPFGDITRRDHLKTAANQVVYDVTFWETIDAIYPTSTTNSSATVVNSVTEYNEAASDQFDDSVDVSDPASESRFRNEYSAIFDRTVSVLQPIADSQDDTQRSFNAAHDSIASSLTLLSDRPDILADQSIFLTQTPSYSQGSSAAARLSAYSGLTSSFIGSEDSIADPDSDRYASNTFHTRDLFCMTYITGMVLSSINSEFVTKSDALTAAEDVSENFNALAAWRDLNYLALGEVDTGTAYQKLHDAVSICIGALVEISFSLKQERRITLSRSRTVIDLISELYGCCIDEELDDFILANELTGSEILELKKGREIVYYV